jgi:hypothetical protein
MNWKQWKVGLFVALLSGTFTGLIGLCIGMTWRNILILIVVNVAKDGLLYLQQHPADSISFDTQTIKRTDVDGSSVESTVRKTTVSTPAADAAQPTKE